MRRREIARSDRRGFIERDPALAPPGQLAIREIARRTGRSRNSIRKYLASEVNEPKYPARTSPSKLGSYAETL